MTLHVTVGRRSGLNLSFQSEIRLASHSDKHMAVEISPRKHDWCIAGKHISNGTTTRVIKISEVNIWFYDREICDFSKLFSE